MRIALLVLAFILVSCNSAEVGEDFIPSLQVECEAGQASHCSGTALPVFVGIARSLVQDCDDFLLGKNALQRRQSFIASGTATSTRSGIYLVATIDSWVAPDGGSIDQLDTVMHQLCAFIDTNGDGDLDTNEPVATGNFFPGVTGQRLIDWKPAFN